jgi:hypothetical protein
MSGTEATAWRETPGGFRLNTGAMRLAVTDQTGRACGWCWHVSADHEYGSDDIQRGGGLATCDDAKAAAIAWARAYCETTLAALAVIAPERAS